MDVRLSPTRAASAIRRVFGHKVQIDKCVYVTKNTVIYTATGNIKSKTAFGGIIQVSSEGMLSSTISSLIGSGNQALQRKLADFTAMLGRLGFYDSEYVRYRHIPRKMTKVSKPTALRITITNPVRVGSGSSSAL